MLYGTRIQHSGCYFRILRDGNRIGHITPKGTVRGYPLPTSNSEPYDIISGPDGNLWFTEEKSNKIGRMTPQGTLTEFPLSPNAVPSSMTVGPDGALWFLEVGNYQLQVGKFVGGNKIGRVTTGGALTEYSIPTPNSNPGEIINGPDGNLWFTEGGFNVDKNGHITDVDQIGRITPSGRITEYPLPTNGYEPVSLITGPDGNLWFTAINQGGSEDRCIGFVTPQGTISKYTLPLLCQPKVLVKGPDGNLWFNEDLNSKIGRITTGGAATQYPVPTPNGASGWMTLGPDGNFWFTEVIGNKIGRITLQGRVTEYPLPTPNSKPEYMVVGPDKNLWFTELGSNKIGRICCLSDINDVFPNHNFSFRHAVTAHRAGRSETSADVALPRIFSRWRVGHALGGWLCRVRHKSRVFCHNSLHSTDTGLLQKPPAVLPPFFSSLCRNRFLELFQTDGDWLGTGIKKIGGRTGVSGG